MSRIRFDHSYASLFGIVIPVRHMPHELAGSIDSILSQTIDGRPVDSRDVDLVVVVDDPDSKTIEVLNSYGARLRWILGSGRGQAAAVNKGLAKVDGEIVKWVNADDRLLPGALETVARAFEKDADLDFIYGDTVFLDAQEIRVGLHLEPRFSKFVLLYGHNLFADPACFWRARVNDKFGMISETTRYSLDYEFWVRIANRGARFAQVKRQIAAFKITGENMSVVYRKEMRKEHFSILTEYYPIWRVFPTKIRHLLLDSALLTARATKTVMTGFQRGWREVGTFGKLVAEGEPK